MLSNVLGSKVLSPCNPSICYQWVRKVRKEVEGLEQSLSDQKACSSLFLPSYKDRYSQILLIKAHTHFTLCLDPYLSVITGFDCTCSLYRNQGKCLTMNQPKGYLLCLFASLLLSSYQRSLF